MSIKTIKHRIALVAVSVLAAGTLSVVSAPIASAAQATAAADQNLLVDGTWCAATSAAGGVPQTTAATAGGLETDTAPWETAFNGKVVIVPVGATITVTSHSADVVTLTGPLGVQSLSTSGTATLSLSSGSPVITAPVNGVNTIYTLTALSTGTASLVVGTAAGATSTLANTITFSIVAACSSTGFSASKSSVSTTSDATATAAATANVDAAVTAGAGDNLYIIVDGDNAYDANLPAGGTYQVSATNGALVSIGEAPGTAPLKGVGSVATNSTDTNGEIVVRVAPASEAAGGTTVVTITHNGVAVTTKNLTFLGEATKINIVSSGSGTVGTTGANSTGYFLFSLTDAAGRAVPGDVSLSSTSASARTPSITEGKDATINAAVPTTVTALVAALTAPGTTLGAEGFDCTSVGGTGSTTLTLEHTQAVTGAKISTTFAAQCAGGVETYTVSTDKASYAIGEIATTTITAKDSTGAAVSDATSVGTADVVTFGGGSMVVGAKAADLFTGGVRTYKAQATTAGTFNAVVSIAGGTTKSATAAYKVSGGDASNAEVLKSIVALIASINKQIQALQKLILKR
jgi:hypothetical protein